MKDKHFKGVNLTDRISVPTQRKITDAGQMIVPCAFARTGSLTYAAKSLGIQDAADGEVVEVVRLEEDVFAEDTMESFRSSPVTLGHPKDESGKTIHVTADNAKDLQVGMLEGMPVRDEDLVSGTLVITNKDAIDAIESGTTELSAGYICDIELRDGTYYQKNIQANHIAIVDKGRAGSTCSIADEDNIPSKESEVEDTSKGIKTEDVTDAEWYKNYATEAMAKAHADVAVAARKIAKKKAKSVVDSAELEGGDDLAKDVTSILVALDVADETVVKLESKLKELEDSVDEEVKTRCDVIIQAKDMTDIKDFSGKSVTEIKGLVVADVLGLDLKDKSDAYVEARFDILCEDSDNLDTPMGRLLKKQAVEDSKPMVYKNPVAEARTAMIERNKINKGN